MPHLALSNLESQVDTLAQKCRNLLRENGLLREHIAQLQNEITLLNSKNQHAVIQINQVITQLRDEIHERIA